jgi:hypothetical protein
MSHRKHFVKNKKMGLVRFVDNWPWTFAILHGQFPWTLNKKTIEHHLRQFLGWDNVHKSWTKYFMDKRSHKIPRVIVGFIS